MDRNFGKVGEEAIMEVLVCYLDGSISTTGEYIRLKACDIKLSDVNKSSNLCV